MNTADVLDSAAEALETYGWVQGTYGTEAVGFCVQGACWHAAGGLMAPKGDQAVLQLCRQLVIRDVVTWNDDPDRTKEEVVAALRAAAAAERAS